jgi:hypothetical protein
LVSKYTCQQVALLVYGRTAITAVEVHIEQIHFRSPIFADVRDIRHGEFEALDCLQRIDTAGQLGGTVDAPHR